MRDGCGRSAGGGDILHPLLTSAGLSTGLSIGLTHPYVQLLTCSKVVLVVITYTPVLYWLCNLKKRKEHALLNEFKQKLL